MFMFIWVRKAINNKSKDKNVVSKVQKKYLKRYDVNLQRMIYNVLCSCR